MTMAEIKAYMMEGYWEEYHKEMAGIANDYHFIYLMMQDVGFSPAHKGNEWEMEDAISYWKECLRDEYRKMMSGKENYYSYWFMMMNDCGIAC